MNPEEHQATGEALLATVFHLMTGREIEVCDRMISGEWQSDLASHERNTRLWRNADRCPHCDEVLDTTISEPDESDSEKLDLELQRFDSLAIQFSREIADFINAKNTAASRLAVETHSRLHPV